MAQEDRCQPEEVRAAECETEESADSLPSLQRRVIGRQAPEAVLGTGGNLWWEPKLTRGREQSQRQRKQKASWQQVYQWQDTNGAMVQNFYREVEASEALQSLRLKTHPNLSILQFSVHGSANPSSLQHRAQSIGNWEARNAKLRCRCT